MEEFEIRVSLKPVPEDVSSFAYYMTAHELTQ